MTRLHLYAITLCVLASPIATTYAKDTSSDYGTADSVSRDRYSDKFMTRPGAAQVTGRAGGRLPSQRPTPMRPDTHPISAPQVPPSHPQGRKNTAGNPAGDRAAPQTSTDSVVNVGSKAPVADSDQAQPEPLARTRDASGTHGSNYTRGYHEPLINGLRSIAPGNCRLEIQDGSQNTLVTWESNGRPWEQVLRQTVNGAGLYPSVVRTPCVVAVASSPGMAERMATGRSSISDGPDPYAVSGSSTASSKSVVPDEPIAQERLTNQEYLAEYVRADIRAASLQEAFETIAPSGWDVRLEIEDASLLSDTYDITAETTRGQIIASLEQQLRVRAVPYLGNRILVVSEQ